jgi:toxin YoeB
MKVLFTQQGWDDLTWWHTQDRTNALKVLELIQDFKRNPWTGLGKPEPLKYLKGQWSRKIDPANRLVYQMSGKGDSYQLMVISCRGHFE